MRNFPLSYFENVDMLFRIKGKSKKTNTKSCNNFHRKSNNQEEKSVKPKEEGQYDCKRERMSQPQGEKDNMKTLKLVG